MREKSRNQMVHEHTAREFEERREQALKPAGIPTAYLALNVMSDVIDKLVEGEITAAQADAVLRGLNIGQLRAC